MAIGVRIFPCLMILERFKATISSEQLEAGVLS